MATGVASLAHRDRGHPAMLSREMGKDQPLPQFPKGQAVLTLS